MNHGLQTIIFPELLPEGGAQSQQAVTDVAGWKLIASVTDADGNVIGLLQLPARSITFVPADPGRSSRRQRR
jgi:hypothetical protein